MNPLALQDADNEMLKDADDYLRRHKILELFEVSVPELTFEGPHHPPRLQAAGAG